MGDAVRCPDDRNRPLDLVPLALLRGEDSVLAPDDDVVLRLGDQLLVAGRPAARMALEATMTDRATAAYVVDGAAVPSGWLWRRLTRRSAERV
jgi:hypothetical protein